MTTIKEEANSSQESLDSFTEQVNALAENEQMENKNTKQDSHTQVHNETRQSTSTSPLGFDPSPEDQVQMASFTTAALTHVLVSPMMLTSISPSIFQQLNRNNHVMLSSTQNSDHSEDAEMKVAGKPRELTMEEKRQRRLWRNRLAAKECRKKKKIYVEELKVKIKELEDQNELLRKEVVELKGKLSFFDPSSNSAEETFKLIKEVEALNAKLGITK
ncbi:hypothetical protein G6F37_000359 [Rhizopus arrhizus]|jgi:hypothetical protein|nr:hypothetical protein G6F38_000465 [Rhizopus arrhizus]KAG1164372.1 hypothetical protein G6F37_000359 [Rhizopus arrhizus]